MKSYRVFVKDPEGNLSEICSVGASAYEIAVLNGFNGTQQEWLDSLVGSGSSSDSSTGGDGATINDSNSSTTTTYSSYKINKLVNALVNDNVVSKTSTYSSTKLKEKFEPLENTSHTHSNKATLDKISESEDNVLLFNEKEIGGDSINDIVTSNATTYSSTKIEARIAESTASVGLSKEIITELPTENIDINTLYLKLAESTETEDVYNQYLYINNEWAFIGNTSTDLSGYYTKEETNTQMGTITSDISTLKTKAHTHSNKATLDKISETDNGTLLFDNKEIKVTMTDDDYNAIAAIVVAQFVDAEEVAY